MICLGPFGALLISQLFKRFEICSLSDTELQPCKILAPWLQSEHALNGIQHNITEGSWHSNSLQQVLFNSDRQNDDLCWSDYIISYCAYPWSVQIILRAETKSGTLALGRAATCSVWDWAQTHSHIFPISALPHNENKSRSRRIIVQHLGTRYYDRTQMVDLQEMLRAQSHSSTASQTVRENVSERTDHCDTPWAKVSQQTTVGWLAELDIHIQLNYQQPASLQHNNDKSQQAYKNKEITCHGYQSEGMHQLWRSSPSMYRMLQIRDEGMQICWITVSLDRPHNRT